ncbi:MAG TPA: hypothetical protein VFS00_07925 [Polyangiaceae bacterium]|nr:hypothetical protein [Polyangiaceae bacterium]
MRRRLWCRALPWLASASAALTGCASAPPPAAPAPPPPVVAAPVEPPVDLSPVPEPATLVAVARWKNVAATLGAVDKMTNLASRAQQELERQLGGVEAVKAIKLDGNFELAAMLEPGGTSPTPELFAAVSMPLRSADEARAAAERQGVTVRQLRPGSWRLARRRGQRGATCDIAASKGDAPARLVCARRERDLDALAPFLTRTLPEQALGKGDISVRVRMAPVRETYGRFLDTTGRAFGPAAAVALAGRMGISDPLIGETVADLAGEASDLLQDVDELSFEGTIEPGGAYARAVGAVRYRGKRSWTARVLTHKNDQAGPPPPIFWLAPKDSDSVGYSRGSDRELARAPLKRIGALASALLRPVLGEPDRRALERAVANMPVYDTTSVTARGHLDPPAPPAKAAPNTPAERVRAARDAFAQSLGWTLIGFDGPHVALKDWLRDVATAANGRGVQQLINQGPEELKRLKPAFKAVPPPAGLPPGSSAFEFSANIDSDLLDRAADVPIPDAPPKKAPAAAKARLSALVVVMPDGVDRAWVGVASDPAQLKKRLLSVRMNAPAENKLSAREGLEALREEKHLSASFSSLAGFASSLRGGLVAAVLRDKSPMADVDATVRALPHKGQTPVFFVSDGAAGDAPSNAVELRVRRETIEDAIAFVIALAAGAQAPGPVVPRP